MELTDHFFCDDYDGYSLNDELPELDSLNDDGMLWFKARNPAKWGLWPLIKIDGAGWIFDNYDYEDYNFWEMQLAGGFSWTNDDDYNEYAHFIGPVSVMDRFDWAYYSGTLYINFFGDDDNNYNDSDRFDGDYGSAGLDFWNPLLTSAEPNGYGYTAGSLVSPIAVLKLRRGYFSTRENDEDYGTELYLSDNQDLLILSDTGSLEFEFNYGGCFNQGTGSHWVVEDGLSYLSDTPTDNAFNITIVDFQIDNNTRTVSVVATNNYLSGNDTDSTMYLAHRNKTAYGRQLTRVPMAYDAKTGRWSAAVVLPEDGDYYFFTVAVENDDVYGKVVDHVVCLGPDPDGDSVAYACDNCPDHANPDQADCDANGTGDVCAIALGLSEDCNSDGVPDACNISGSLQWAVSVINFSSQYSGGAWSAHQAAGEPNTFEYGDFPTAWSPEFANGGLEYLTLEYADPVLASGVLIRETYGNGFVYQVDVLDLNDVLHTVWSGVDPSQPGTPVDFLVTFPQTEYLVKGAKVYVDTDLTSSWDEIDAVALLSDVASQDCNANSIPDDCEIVIRGDSDYDGDIDLDDFNGFVSCHAGPGVGAADPSCCTFDFDGDGYVTLIDWGLFEIAFTGDPGKPRREAP